jgi:hypothetical protein
VPPEAEESRYVRPALPAVTYYSVQGTPVRYGRRWGDKERAENSTVWRAILSGLPGFILSPGR